MTTNTETRTFTEFEVRAGDDGSRHIEGLAVPWGQQTEVGGYVEEFARGAFDAGEAVGTPLYWQHAHGEPPIGRVVEAEDRPTGFWIRARISETVRGTEVYTLLRDEVVRSMSVGFRPVAAEDRDGVTVRTAALIREVSVTPFPAYAGAAIEAVRSQNAAAAETNQEGENMPEIEYAPAEDVAEVRGSVEELTRRVAVLADTGNTGGDEAAPELRFGSLGEYVKALATREATTEDAEVLTRAYADAMTRAYTGADSTDAAPRAGFINRDIKLVRNRRPILNLFSREAMPSSGMSVTYPKFKAATGDVAKQATEGADLTYLELVVEPDTADIGTYGGYSRLTRQAIERADVPYLNKVLTRQKISYGKATNGAVRIALNAATGTIPLSLPASAKAADYTALTIDAVDAIEDQSADLAAEAWIMSTTDYKALAILEDTSGRPIFALNGDGINTLGDVNVRGLRAVVNGMPVFVDPRATAGVSHLVSSEALTVLEDGPFNLTDENVINLSKDFSIYGYLALTLNDPKGIVKVTHTAPAGG